MQAWIVAARQLDRQKPTVLAQLKSGIKSFCSLGVAVENGDIKLTPSDRW
jgi:hypothetical protein